VFVLAWQLPPPRFDGAADKSISGAHRTPIETRRKHRLRHGYGDRHIYDLQFSLAKMRQ
jgi:hypothetical protein